MGQMHQEDGAEHDYDDEKGSNPDKETDQDCDSANELGECNQETMISGACRCQQSPGPVHRIQLKARALPW